MKGTMRAVVVRAPGDFGLEEVPIPEAPKGGFLLKVTACGLCGSDLRTLRAGHLRVTLPWIIGHEICGTFVEPGPGYEGPWKEGDLLAVGPITYCGACEFCRAGTFEFCENYLEIAQAWPGGFADYLYIPERAVRLGNIRPVPAGVDPAFAAITEPISSCIHAQEKGNVGLGDTVVIIGAGPVGCTHVCLARARGAVRIILADIVEERLALAAPFEPDLLINAERTDLVGAVREATGGRGADVIITATSAPRAPVQAVEMARKAGRILIFGGLPRTDSKPGVDLNLIHYNALHMIGTTTFGPRHHGRALEMVASGMVRADKLVTHRFPLDAFAEGVQMALDGKVLKAVFLPCRPSA